MLPSMFSNWHTVVLFLLFDHPKLRWSEVWKCKMRMKKINEKNDDCSPIITHCEILEANLRVFEQ